MREVLSSPGRPLDAETRASMEGRFGVDFSRIRVHFDERAVASADAIAARAYAAGHNIVFGAGQFAPGTSQGRRLLSHELTHTLQQGNAQAPFAGHLPIEAHDTPAEHEADAAADAVVAERRPGRVALSASGVQRQPAPGVSRPIKAIVSDLRRSVTFAHSWRAPLAEQLAQAIEAPGVNPLDFGDLRDAISVLVSGGFAAEADRVIVATRRKFVIAFSTGQGLPIPNMLGAIPNTLIRLGQSAARRGDHVQAFSLFEAAQEMLSEYAIQASENAANDLNRERPDDFAARSTRYGTLKEIYSELRSIYSTYGELERDAPEAGKLAEAAALRKQGEALLQRLKVDRFGEGALVEIAEASPATTTTGQAALRYHGADFQETDLTALPGHPLPAEAVGGHSVQNLATIEGTQDILVQQSDLVSDLLREPELRKAFNNQVPDLNEQKARQKAWRVMYGVFAKRDPRPLGALMALIGRYLKAFTIHTSYNVRDFDPSYLVSRFPSDLTGRIVSDCGVYALDVAWDVFQTVKQADPKLKVSFTLATLLDHVVLIIADENAGQWYYVNNDQITPIARTPGFAPTFPRPANLPRHVDVFNEDPPAQRPKDPDPDEEIGRQYSALRDLPFLIAPVNFAPLGSTADAAPAFKSGAWQKYLASTAYMARAAQPAFVTPPITLANLRTFSDASTLLDLAMDQIAVASQDPVTLAGAVQAHFKEAVDLLVALEQLGPRAFNANPALAAAKPAGTEVRGVLRTPGRPHPLLRMALGLVRLQKLGQSLSHDQQKYLKFIEAAFASQMDALRAAAEAGSY